MQQIVSLKEKKLNKNQRHFQKFDMINNFINLTLMHHQIFFQINLVYKITFKKFMILKVRVIDPSIYESSACNS